MSCETETKYASRIFLLFAVSQLFFFRNASAQIIIGTDVRHIEKKVISLSFSGTDPEIPISIEWIKIDKNKQYYHRYNATCIARRGRHVYEMRQYAPWKGDVDLVTVSSTYPVHELTGEIITPRLRDEITIFLNPMRVMPYTVNLLGAHTLFSFSWNTWLIALLLVSAILFALLLRKKLVLVLLLAFVLSWAAMDVRAIYDHIKIVQKTEKDGYVIEPKFKKMRTSTDNCAKIIGSDTWTQNQSQQSYSLYCSILYYGLAECKYVPYDANEKADFLMTIQNGELICQNLKQ
jgi:hypothetical protein